MLAIVLFTFEVVYYYIQRRSEYYFGMCVRLCSSFVWPNHDPSRARLVLLFSLRPSFIGSLGRVGPRLLDAIKVTSANDARTARVTTSEQSDDLSPLKFTMAIPRLL